MSIRVRVTLVTVILVTLALLAASYTAYTLLRHEVYRDATASVRQLASTAVAALDKRGRLDLPILASADRPVWVRLVASDGRPLQQVNSTSLAMIKPPIGGLLKTPGRPQLFFDQKVDAIAVPAGHGETVIAAVALGPAATALSQLSKLNEVIGVAVIVLSAVVAAIVLTLSLRPLRRIAATADLDPVFRQLGALLSVMQGGPDVDPHSVIDRLAPMTSSGNPWRSTALELTAAARLKAGEKDGALEAYKTLADDLTAPQGTRARAAEMAAALAS